jgi:hypothetical protein
MSASGFSETYPISCDIEGETFHVEGSAKPDYCPGCGRGLEDNR